MSTLVNTSSTEISVVKQKYDELLTKSLLTRSQFEGQLKEKTKVISDLKVKEGKDIDTMIEMDKQIKFLNEILYKRNQSIQTILCLHPTVCATYHGRSTFANPKYLKKAQSDKPRLYEIPYDTSDPANRFCPNEEETVTLEKESRSKLNKDTVKPYNYTYQNSLYETFKPPSKAYLDQLERAKEVRKTMWRKTFVRTKPNIAKNVGFLPMSKSISKNKTILDSHCFIHELKKEMNDDLEYVNSLEKELDELESEKADFSNIYDLLLEEFQARSSCQVCFEQQHFKLGPSCRRCRVEHFQFQASVFTSNDAPFLNDKMMSVHISSGLVLHQMTSDHNRSELGIQDHSNEQSSSKLVPKVQFQNEVNDIRSEKLARSANPLALLAAAQPNSDNYYEAPVPQRSNAPSFKQSSSTQTSASTRHKGKRDAEEIIEKQVVSSKKQKVVNGAMTKAIETKKKVETKTKKSAKKQESSSDEDSSSSDSEEEQKKVVPKKAAVPAKKPESSSEEDSDDSSSDDETPKKPLAAAKNGAAAAKKKDSSSDSDSDDV
ncbi:hypothetical protein Tco_0060722 [Tanacetum coccineum]